MKLLLGLFTLLLALGSQAQIVKAKRVTDRSNEIREIEDLVSKINAHGGCEPAQKLVYGKKVDSPRANFDEPRLLAARCGGEIVKKQNGNYKSVSVLKTKCKNVIIGYNRSYGNYFKPNSGEGTRLYQFQFTGLGQEGSQNVRINKEALGYDNDTVVIVTSNSGLSCTYFEANY